MRKVNRCIEEDLLGLKRTVMPRPTIFNGERVVSLWRLCSHSSHLESAGLALRFPVPDGQCYDSDRQDSPLDLRPPIRFGIFEVDLAAGELRKQGVKIKLQEQPFQALVALIERPR